MNLFLKTKDTSMFNLLLTLLGISIRLLIKLENIELNECVTMLDILLLIIHHLQCLSSILLAVGGDMAQLCQKHLKPNDFIYVTGQLHSYSKVDKNGKLCLCYKVVVEDFNYVRECGQGLAFKKSVESKSRG
ncbi:hypothetical protein CISIN_1g0242472mg, partial [Citrus sinensis]